MARIVVLSSWVAHGHVGLSAAAPALQALGHTVTGLPTVILSNHPGWPRVAGHPVPVEALEDMLAAIDGNGWLDGADAILTGYLPTAAHVRFACAAIERVRARAPGCRVVVDPILGDHPDGLYIAEAAAFAIRDRLVRLADVLTPNGFELGWLTGQRCATPGEVLAAAERLLGMGTAQSVLATSVPLSPRETGVLEAGARHAALYPVPRLEGVPHGVGDVFAAFAAAGLGTGTALGLLQALIRASAGAGHLRIAEAAAGWTLALPLAPDAIPETAGD